MVTIKKIGLVIGIMSSVIIISTNSLINTNASVSSNTYYVSPSGNDNNLGTIDNPFKTIQNGVDKLNPGDTLKIRSGKYIEKINIEKSGVSNGFITIQNYENENPILDGSIGDQDGVISISDQSFIRIKGLEITNNSKGDTPSGIFIEGKGKGIEIINNKVHDIKSNDNAHGIAVYGTDSSSGIQDIKLIGNELYNLELGQSESMVVNGNVDNFLIQGNKIHDNNNIGICCIGFENTAKSNDQARNGIVKENTVYNISSKSNPTYYGEECADGIYIDGGKDIVIERNKSYNSNIGIEVSSEHKDKISDNNIVRNNIVYGCNLYGISIGGSDTENGYADKCKIYNNTVYNCEVGVNIQKTKSNEIVNNIVYSKNLLEGSIGSNIIKNNLWYSNIDSKGLSPFSDPKFANALAGDFRLLIDSKAINLGDTSISSLIGDKDYLGNNRIIEGSIDCGAIENSSNQILVTKEAQNTLIPKSTSVATPTNNIQTKNTQIEKSTAICTPQITSINTEAPKETNNSKSHRSNYKKIPSNNSSDKDGMFTKFYNYFKKFFS